MEASEGGGGGKIAEAAMAVLSTHPLSGKRMESMQKWVSESFTTPCLKRKILPDLLRPKTPNLLSRTQLPEAVEIRRHSDCPGDGVMNAFQSTAKRANPFPNSRFS